MRVHILAGRGDSQNTRAFLAPVFAHRKQLREAGLRVRVFAAIDAGIADCDVLMVTSKYFGARWNAGAAEIVDELGEFARHTAVAYADIHDSSGLLRTEVLPVVTSYCKSWLLSDRALYMTPLYGGRLYTDYYHCEFGINDGEPLESTPVTDPALLSKLSVSWNMGLANHSLWGSRISALVARMPVAALLRAPLGLCRPNAPRSRDVAARFGTRYGRATIAFQRRRVRELLGERFRDTKVSRRTYFAEMRDSRVVPSPFGWGEFALRDFEAFLSGAALLKPDMSHLETWPEYYRDGETFVAHGWDLHDFDDKLRGLLDDDDRRVAIAEAGQRAYAHHATSRDGAEAFAARVRGIVADVATRGAA